MNQSVQDTAHTTTQAAKDKARDVGSQVEDKARGQVDSRTTEAGEQMQGRAEALHDVGDQMRERGDDTFAQVADKLAGYTEQAARYLRDADADRIIGDAERFARRQPWAVAAGGALVGFAASRLVRAAAERRSGGSGSGYSSTGTTAGGWGQGATSPAREEIDLTRRYGVTPETGAPGTTGTGYGTGTGYTTGAPLGGPGAGTGTATGGFGTSASVAPEPPQHDTPSQPGPGSAPGVPSTDPAPLGDPEPFPGPTTDPKPGSGQGTTGAGRVDR